MSSTVPAELQDDLDEAGTTTCRLLKIFNRNFSPPLLIGLCSLDIDVAYDDGTSDGEITYSAMNGFDPKSIAADLGFSVENTEGFALLSEGLPGITAESIRAGVLDDAEWICYLVNFQALNHGHVVVGFGDIGKVRIRDGVSWVPELLSYVMRLKQPIGSVWSRQCRAEYGSPAESQTGCGVDITSKWVNGTVQSVAAETDRTFTGDFVAALPSENYPARLQFLTGDNAGREFAVEEVDGLVVSLFETTPYPIQPDDDYRIRIDCRKLYEEDCIGLNDNGDNFKGEPTIPTGDALQSQTPSAQLPGGGGVKMIPA